jgi:hypothetical protein
MCYAIGNLLEDGYAESLSSIQADAYHAIGNTSDGMMRSHVHRPTGIEDQTAGAA